MIKGKKVSLRAVEKTDLESFRNWRNIEDFRRNFREHRELNLWHQEKWFERVHQSSTDYMFTIVDTQSGEALGACGLLYVNWIIRSADFSFYIGKNEEYIDKHGLAAEAAKLLIDYGFKSLNLNKIWMELYEFDTRKLEFFEKKFNFKRDGILRQNCFKDGKYHDSVLISILSHEVN